MFFTTLIGLRLRLDLVAQCPACFQSGVNGFRRTGTERFYDFGNLLTPGSSAQRRVVVASPIAGMALLQVTLIRQGPSGGKKVSQSQEPILNGYHVTAGAMKATGTFEI